MSVYFFSDNELLSENCMVVRGRRGAGEVTTYSDELAVAPRRRTTLAPVQIIHQNHDHNHILSVRYWVLLGGDVSLASQQRQRYSRLAIR